MLKVRVVGLRPCTHYYIIRQTARKESQPSQLAQPPLELVARNGGVSVARHDQADARSCAGRMRERGSDDPDVEVSGPNALPLSRNALQLGAPRDSCLLRKAERRLGRPRLPRTCPECGR